MEMDWKQGTPIGEYQILKKLRQGPEGVLYRSRNTNTEEHQSLIVFPENGPDNRSNTLQKLLLTKIETLAEAGISSNNAVKGLWRFDGLCFLVADLPEDTLSKAFDSVQNRVEHASAALPENIDLLFPSSSRQARAAAKSPGTLFGALVQLIVANAPVAGLIVVTLLVLLLITGVMSEAFGKISLSIERSDLWSKAKKAIAEGDPKTRIDKLSSLLESSRSVPGTARVRAELGKLLAAQDRLEDALGAFLAVHYQDPAVFIGRELLDLAGRFYDCGRTEISDLVCDRIIDWYAGTETSWKAVLLKKHLVIERRELSRIISSVKKLLKSPLRLYPGAEAMALNLLENAESIKLKKRSQPPRDHELQDYERPPIEAGPESGALIMSLSADLLPDLPGLEEVDITLGHKAFRITMLGEEDDEGERVTVYDRTIQGRLSSAFRVIAAHENGPAAVLGLSSDFDPECFCDDQRRRAGLYTIRPTLPSLPSGSSDASPRIEMLRMKAFEPAGSPQGALVRSAAKGTPNKNSCAAAAFEVWFPGRADAKPETRVLVLKNDGELLWLHYPHRAGTAGQASLMMAMDNELIVEKGDGFMGVRISR